MKGTPGSGAPIAVELWSLPFEKVGSFLEAIPAPLGIGTVDLSDGRQVKGFICEAEAVADGTDITQTGDWRRYLVDLSRFDAAPLIASTATKETNYGTETHR